VEVQTAAPVRERGRCSPPRRVHDRPQRACDAAAVVGLLRSAFDAMTVRARSRQRRREARPTWMGAVISCLCIGKPRLITTGSSRLSSSFRSSCCAPMMPSLFAEVDEFVHRRPLGRYAGLDAYIAEVDPTGGEMFGLQRRPPAGEPPCGWMLRCLRSGSTGTLRSFTPRASAFQDPLRWSDGFHHEYNAPDDPPDPELLLVHCIRVDYDMSLTRHQAAASRDWNEADVAMGSAAQNRIVGCERVRRVVLPRRRNSTPRRADSRAPPHIAVNALVVPTNLGRPARGVPRGVEPWPWDRIVVVQDAPEVDICVPDTPQNPWRGALEFSVGGDRHNAERPVDHLPAR